MLDMCVKVALYFGLKTLSMMASNMYVCDYPHDLTSSKDHIFSPRIMLICVHAWPPSCLEGVSSYA